MAADLSPSELGDALAEMHRRHAEIVGAMNVAIAESIAARDEVRRLNELRRASEREIMALASPPGPSIDPFMADLL